MSTNEEIVTALLPEIRPTLWERIGLKARRIWMAMKDRGPTDFYDEEQDERLLLIRVLRELAKQLRSSSGGHGSVTSSKLLNWLMALNIAATLALGGWILATLAQNATDIAVIKCQLNPQGCPQVRANGR